MDKPQNVPFKKLTYFGILRSISSWAKVSRELLTALAELEVPLGIYERKGFLFDRSFSLEAALAASVSQSFDGDLLLTFENPRVYHYLPQSTRNIGFLVYEFNKVPDPWVEAIEKHLSLVVVPSMFCRESFLAAGVPAAKLRVLRYGINPRYYFPAAAFPPNQLFTFLCIANPHKREGLELLLEGYSKAFSANDPVQLLLKLTYLPAQQAKTFEYPDLLKLISIWQARPDAPRLKVIERRLSEEEMGALYRSAHCYVSLSRAEAFGLCFLESLACGLPIIALDWSGQRDFLNATNTHFVPFELVPTQGEEYELTNEPQIIAQPDVPGAAEIMRGIFEGKTASRPEVKIYPSIEHYYWSAVARDFLALAEELFN